ncbi:MAG: HAD family hydrolase, partial [Sedimentisphaerales bacterium]|nr:HAD family hydrolase [Sedimentisphaerales bacterium]
MGKRAVFLDRDGTVLEHYDYLTDPGQVQLLPTAATALRRLKEHGFVLVMVTNQSAVARGMLTEETLYEIHDRAKELLAEKGAYLDQIYYCPYHPEGAIPRYRRDSELRKPAPGMLLLAAKELQLDLELSWMVGDDDRDIEAGRRAGCRTILLDSYSTSILVRRGRVNPDYRAVNLQEAANLILHHSERPVPQPPVVMAEEPPVETIEEPPADQAAPEPPPAEEIAPSI